MKIEPRFHKEQGLSFFFVTRVQFRDLSQSEVLCRVTRTRKWDGPCIVSILTSTRGCANWVDGHNRFKRDDKICRLNALIAQCEGSTLKEILGKIP